MAKIVQLSDKLLVAPQIDIQDLAVLKAMGVSTVISNRHEGECADQPTVAEFQSAAARIGIDFVHLPIGMTEVPSSETVAAFERAVAGAGGDVLAFCRSGARSARIWAFTQARRLSANEILGTAGAAGFDLSGMRDHLSQMRETVAA